MSRHKISIKVPSLMTRDKTTGRLRMKDKKRSLRAKKAMRHLKGKRRSAAHIKAARLGLLHTLKTGRTRHGRKSKIRLAKHTAHASKGRRGAHKSKRHAGHKRRKGLTGSEKIRRAV